LALNIAVNTRLLIINKLEGIGWFTYEVVSRLARQHPEHRFIFLFDRPFHERFIFSDNIVPVVVPPKARHPLLFYYWFERKLPAVLAKHKADLFFSPDGYLSLNSHVKSLPVIHDLNFAHRPGDLPFLIRKYYNFYFPRFAQKAARIATVSNYSKLDIHKTFKVPEEKIDVVYNGVNPIYKPVNKEVKDVVKQQFANGGDYFIYVGSLHKRKNIKNILLAFDAFKKNRSSGFKLVLVGNKMFNDNEIQDTFHHLDFKNDVVFTGRLDNKELKDVLASAYAMLFVPFFEGFGLPLLEAMACGIPVITSEVTSLPEVAGNAALYADPYSIDSILEQMIALTSDDKLYKRLITTGFERLKIFSWDQTASLVWKSIEKTLNQG
jgi:glycosyltransferase involved in cell wall biosynthesis